MNKKLSRVLPVLALLSVAIVSAALIQHYGVFQQDIEVNQPIEVTGDTSQSVPCEAGLSCDGSEITIENDGTQEIRVLIEDITQEEGILTEYISSLTLTKKDVDFSKDVWENIDETIEVNYKIVGNEFSAELVNPLEGYVLIYYKDNSDRFNSPAEGILVEDVEGNLPYENDKNADEYDYCETGEYLTCHGAKIWAIPSNAINEGVIDWSQANDFYFETELIQFNSEGEIITYPGNPFIITPNYELHIALEQGTYTIETQVNPIA